LRFEDQPKAEEFHIGTAVNEDDMLAAVGLGARVLSSGFGGLGVSALAEAVGFFRAKKSSARLPSEGK
jgi:hypothetical protein